VARRRSDESGTPNTCPFIDEAISEIDNCECESVDKHRAKAALEKVRGYNDDLRQWGNDQYYELQDAENRIGELEYDKDDLQSQVKNLLEEIKTLEFEISKMSEYE
jgi:chromosome segregation ATPase